MRRVFAALGSALFFVLAPGTVAGSPDGVLRFGGSLYRLWEACLSPRELWSCWIHAGIRMPPVVIGCHSYLLENAEMLRILFVSGMNPDLPNWQRQTFLHDLCRGRKRGETWDRIGSAAILLDAGASVSARDEEYRSPPLAWAARTNMPDMFGFLLARGAPAQAMATADSQALKLAALISLNLRYCFRR